MASVRAQILAAAEAKLSAVRVALAWQTLIRNPREKVGEDQLDALVMVDGGDRAPEGLTGHVEYRWVEFAVGWLVRETSADTIEELLDAALVAIIDALIDPDDIQLGGLAIAIEQGEIGEPVIGRSETGARIVGGQWTEFAVQYLAREGDASTPGP